MPVAYPAHVTWDCTAHDSSLVHAVCIAVFVALVCLFMVEARGVENEAIQQRFASHWFWKRFAGTGKSTLASCDN